MFKKKRLARVEVLLKHGRKGDEDIHETIEIALGQTFHKEIGGDFIRENGVTIKAFDWKPGYTVLYNYFYY